MLEGRDRSRDDVDRLAADGPSTGRRGRPVKAQQMVPITVRVPPALYDEYCRASVSTTMRTASPLVRDALVAYLPMLLRRRRRG